MTCLLDGAHRIVWRVLDFSTALHYLGHVVSHQLAKQRQPRLRFIPVCCSDLRRRQPNKAIAAFQRVIEEGEFMISRQRGQPERQARQIDRARVLVDAIEASLRHQAAGM